MSAASSPLPSDAIAVQMSSASLPLVPPPYMPPTPGADVDVTAVLAPATMPAPYHPAPPPSALAAAAAAPESAQPRFFEVPHAPPAPPVPAPRPPSTLSRPSITSAAVLHEPRELAEPFQPQDVGSQLESIIQRHEQHEHDAEAAANQHQQNSASKPSTMQVLLRNRIQQIRQTSGGSGSDQDNDSLQKRLSTSTLNLGHHTSLRMARTGTQDSVRSSELNAPHHHQHGDLRTGRLAGRK